MTKKQMTKKQMAKKQMAKKQILVSTLDKGFHKVTYDDRTFEYISPKKLEALKADKTISVVEAKLVEAKKDGEDNTPNSSDDSDDSDKGKPLNRMNKAELLDIAGRYGNTNNELSNKELVKFIETEQAKS